MRIKKISNDRVTVYLTVQDLEYFDFHPTEVPPKPSDLHDFLFELMELVQTETGFDPYHGGQVVVEATHSEEGMKLNIRKLGTAKPEKLTREQFARCKKIKVKNKDTDSDDMGGISKSEFIRLLKDAGLISEKKPEDAQKKTTFVFNSFADLEGALCLTDIKTLKECTLYRSKDRYALLTRLKPAGRTYNLLSEFAAVSRRGDVLDADIRENWVRIAHRDALVSMAEALRSMK